MSKKIENKWKKRLINAFQLIKNGKQLGHLKFDEFCTRMDLEHDHNGEIVHPKKADIKLPMIETLDEVLNIISNEMGLPDRQQLKTTAKKDLIMYHSGFGMRIRNEFRLWEGNHKLVADMGLPKGCHADEVSFAIIEALWDRFQGEE